MTVTGTSQTARATASATTQNENQAAAATFSAKTAGTSARASAQATTNRPTRTNAPGGAQGGLASLPEKFIVEANDDGTFTIVSNDSTGVATRTVLAKLPPLLEQALRRADIEAATSDAREQATNETRAKKTVKTDTVEDAEAEQTFLSKGTMNSDTITIGLKRTSQTNARAGNDVFVVDHDLAADLDADESLTATTKTLVGGKGRDTLILPGKEEDWTLNESVKGFQIYSQTTPGGKSIQIVASGIGNVQFAETKEFGARLLNSLHADGVGNEKLKEDIAISSPGTKPGTRRDDTFTIAADAGAFSVHGRAGNDLFVVDPTFEPAGLSETTAKVLAEGQINGGTGRDTVRLPGSASDWKVEKTEDGTTVVSTSDSSDHLFQLILRNVETIEFSDGTTVSGKAEKGKTA